VLLEHIFQILTKTSQKLFRGENKPSSRLCKLPPSIAMNKKRINPDSCFHDHCPAELRPEEIRQKTKNIKHFLFFLKETNY
jgi:hypothetical protein